MKRDGGEDVVQGGATQACWLYEAYALQLPSKHEGQKSHQELGTRFEGADLSKCARDCVVAILIVVGPR